MEITSEQLKEKITNGEKLLIDFYGKFCGPCKVMKPWFESVTEENKTTDSNQLPSLGLYTSANASRNYFCTSDSS